MCPEESEFALCSIRLTTPPRRFVCGPEWRFSLRLKDYDFWLVTAGRGTLTINSKQLNIIGPQCFVFFPDEKVEGRHDPSKPLEVYGFHFIPTPRSRVVERQLRMLNGRPIGASASLQEIAEVMVRVAETQDGVGKRTAEHLGLALLSLSWQQRFVPPPLPSDPRVDRVIREIRLHPERSWTIEGMALECRISRTHLNGRFLRLTGKSPMSYVIQQRIKKAGELLLNTDLSIKEIADLCGYQDVFYFTRQFCKWERVAPGMYRKRALSL